MRVPLPLPLGSYETTSPTQSIRRVINWIPVTAQSDALNARNLLQPSGISQFANTGLGPCRGAHVMAEVKYFVQGTSLISFNSTNTLINHGTIPGSSKVQMADNGSKLVIVVPGAEGYSFNAENSTLTQITDTDYQLSDSVQFFRGFFVFTATDGKQLFVSNLNQPLVFDALDFGSAEGDPDRIVTQIVDHDELSIIGSQTTEVFRNIGGADFPLQIIQGAYTEKGAHSKYGVIKFDNTYLFIGGGENELTSIWRQTSSSQAVKISDDAIDSQIQKYTKDEIAQAFTMSFSKKGQLFAIFTFNSTRIPSKTLVYNGTASALSGSSVWSEFQTGLNDASWRVNSVIKADGKLYVGDAIDGRIGIIDDSVFTEYGDTVMRQAAFQPFSQNGTTLFAGELEATFQSGVGLNNGQGSNPQVIYDFTDDGHTWSNEFRRSIGAIGEYGHETVWNRQGRFPSSRTIRLTITEPVNANLIRVAATPDLGNG